MLWMRYTTKDHVPDGLVGDDDLSPLLLGELLGGGVELPGDDVDGLVGLTLLQISIVLGGFENKFGRWMTLPPKSHQYRR